MRPFDGNHGLCWQFAGGARALLGVQHVTTGYCVLVIALIAAFVGFGNVANLSWEGAKILFFIFIVLAVLSFLGNGYRRGTFWG